MKINEWASEKTNYYYYYYSSKIHDNTDYSQPVLKTRNLVVQSGVSRLKTGAEQSFPRQSSWEGFVDGNEVVNILEVLCRRIKRAKYS